VNKIKAEHKIFQEDAPTEMLPHRNPRVLLMWKASTHTQEESLFILNKDIHNEQYFYEENLQRYVQAGAPLLDISPEYPLDYIPVPFSYNLQPGQGIVLITSRDTVPED
jgi:starch synthase (maltosyl-transferring)